MEKGFWTNIFCKRNVILEETKSVFGSDDEYWLGRVRAHLMVVVGYILWILGLIAANIGTIMFFAVAYRRGLGWLVSCLIFPLLVVAWPMLLVVQFRRTILPVLITLLGFAAASCGASLAGLAE